MTLRERGYLLLEDGTRFDGELMGAPGQTLGEAVFNTSMTGYQEVLTDPSYAGQIVTMTYPLIGNYGVAAQDAESGRVQVAGYIVRELPPAHSSWRSEGPLEEYLAANGIVGLCEIDTRALTIHLRSRGAMRAGIAPASVDAKTLMQRIQDHPRMEGLDLTADVSTSVPYETAAAGTQSFRVLAYDFGVKRNSLRLLAERGCRVTTLPASTPPGAILEREPDGFFLSNGPGDPEAVGHALDTIRQLGERGIPTFGICLGHQLMGRAYGATTFKLLYGHRAGNHPVRRLSDDAVEITSQNHGFAVKRGSGVSVEGAPALQVTHVNLNDQTMEGLEHREYPAFSVQYHPEAAPGPHDSRYLFDRFVSEMRRSQANT